MAKLAIDINRLSPQERRDLIEVLWDSLAEDPARIPLTEAQANALSRRVAEREHDDSLGTPWKQFSCAFVNVSEVDRASVTELTRSLRGYMRCLAQR